MRMLDRKLVKVLETSIDDYRWQIGKLHAKEQHVPQELIDSLDRAIKAQKECK